MLRMNPSSDHVVSGTQTPIESVESSIQNLLKSFYRRLEYWKLLLNASEEQNQQLISKAAPWRNQLASFLESTTVRAITMSLLLLDLLFTILELASSLLHSCAPKKNDYSDSLDDHQQVWYHWVGVAILCVVSLKTMALAVALGRGFFRRPGNVIDGVVVIGAVFLEAFLERRGGGLLVIVSLWRVMRVVESAFELSDEAIEAQIQSILCQFQALRDENIKLNEIIAEKDVIIDMLREQLYQYCQQHASTSAMH